MFCFVAVVSAVPEGYSYQSQSGADLLVSSSAAVALESQSTVKIQQQPVITKRFFIHSAPEEEEVEIQQKDIFIGTPRKSYNVVFIKSPIAPRQKTKVRVIPAASEDKTVIYVLSKKSQPGHLETYIEEPVTTTVKPEVFFIKYRTNEEAEHAQHHIQAEYDHLGGSTVVSNEGISPVSSVIGSLDHPKEDESSSIAYLPTVAKQ